MEKRSKLFGLIALWALLLAGCTNPVVPEDTAGSITGKALYVNSDNHSGITVSLERTDGLRSLAVLSAARGIAADGSTSSGARSIAAARAVAINTQTSADGLYSFENVTPGVYTVYASSVNSSEKAVAINIGTVEAGKSVTADDLLLTPTGNITGRIVVDGKPTGNMGFLVYVAGTSYMAMTNDDGSFTISDIPAGEYSIIIMKGNYTQLLESSITVTGGETWGPFDRIINGADVVTRGIYWLGERAEAPSAGWDEDSSLLNWAYYNTQTRTSYIWTGTDWDILAVSGQDGEHGTNGVTPEIINGYWYIGMFNTGVKAEGTNGAAPKIINGYWYIDGTSTGVKAEGSDGEDGTNGAAPIIKDGYWWIGGVNTNVKAEGKDGTNGTDGEDGTDGVTPVIKTDGYWWIGGVNTGVKAKGVDGTDGTNGATPEIKDGYWHVNGVNTWVKAEGVDGTDGTNGATPEIKDGYWWIGGVNTGVKAKGIDGTNGTDGEDGIDGNAGTIDATISIGANGNWYIDGVDTNVKAQGPQGNAGATPEIIDGYWWIGGTSTGVKTTGKDGAVPKIVNGYWWIDGVNTGVRAEEAKTMGGAIFFSSLDTWYDGAITQSSGEQWFRFKATGSTQYLHVYFGGLTDLYIQLYTQTGNALGNRIPLSGSSNSTKYTALTVAKDEYYYVKVTPYSSSGSGTFRIGYNTSPQGPGVLTAATTLSDDTWKDATMVNGEAQWFTFTATSSTQYLHIYYGTLTGVYIQLYDVTGNTLGSSIELSGNTNTSGYRTFTVMTSEKYYIKVTPRYGGDGASGIYKIGYNTSPQAPGVLKAATTLSDDTWKDATMVNGEAQWFTFTATSSTQYLHIYYGTLTGVYIQLYDVTGNTLGSSIELGGNTNTSGYRTFTVVTSEKYYIKVTPRYGGDGASGTYKIGFNTSTTSP